MRSAAILALAIAAGGSAFAAPTAEESFSAPTVVNRIEPGTKPPQLLSAPWPADPLASSPSAAGYPPWPWPVSNSPNGQTMTSDYQAAAQGQMPSVPDPSRDLYRALQDPGNVSDATAGICDLECGCRGCWFGYLGGLVMTRNEPNKYWTTYDQANNNFQNLNTEDANVHWDGGGEFTFGYRRPCDSGIELTYWGVWNMTGSASVTSSTDSLGTPLDTTNGAAGLLLGGVTPDSFFTNAHAVYLWRDDQVDNVEINFTYNPWGYDNCGWNLTWLAGVRYFKFDENLLWTSVAGGFNLGDNGGADQANINVHCENDLIGVQCGAVLNYRFGNHLSIFAIPKIGIFGNAAESESRYYRGDGVVGFDITGHKDTVSFLGSLDLGLNYDLGRHWSFVAGYRVVAVSGIALADNQLPYFLAAADEFADTKVNGDVVVHGVFLGGTFRY